MRLPPPLRTTAALLTRPSRAAGPRPGVALCRLLAPAGLALLAHVESQETLCVASMRLGRCHQVLFLSLREGIALGSFSPVEQQLLLADRVVRAFALAVVVACLRGRTRAPCAQPVRDFGVEDASALAVRSGAVAV